MSDLKDAWVQRVLGLTVTRDAPQGEARGLRSAQETWTTSRGRVVGVLKELETAIRAMRHPQGDPAIILVKAIAANLTVLPGTRAAVAELRRYLTTDSIIDDAETPNGFGIEIRIREPLLAALGGIEQALPASA